MKKILSVILSMVLLLASYTPGLSTAPVKTGMLDNWTRTWGGSGSDGAGQMALDSYGNLYIAGSFSGSVYFDPTHTQAARVSNGAEDAYLSKFDANGNWLWTRTWGGSGRDVAYSVAVDSNNNAYLTGPYTYTVDFDPGPNVVSSTSQAGSGAKNNIYFSKFDPNGNFVWVKTWGPSGAGAGAEGYALAIDASDNIYLVGDFSVNNQDDKCDFNPWGAGDLHGNHGFYDGFLAKFDTDGGFKWAKTWGGLGYDDTVGVTLDGSDTVYVIGMYGSTDINFDPAGSAAGTHNGASEFSYMYVDAYFTKFNAAGEFQWVRTWGKAGTTEAGHKVLIDHDHNIYIGGRFECTNCNFDGTKATQAMHSTNGGLGDTTGKDAFDAYISKYSASGNFLWTRTWGGSSWDTVNALAVDAANHLYVLGDFNKILCNPANPNVYPVCPANFASTVDFDPGPGSAPVTSHLYADMFLSKFTPDGALEFVKTWGSDGKDDSAYLLINAADEMFLSGSFQNTIDFDPSSPVDSHTSNGANDAFMSKFSLVDLSNFIFLPVLRKD